MTAQQTLLPRTDVHTDPAASQPLTALEIMETGQRCEFAAKLDLALWHYQRAERVAATPEETCRALRFKARVHRRACRWNEAMASLDTGLQIAADARLDDERAYLLSAQGMVWHAQGEMIQAAASYQAGLQHALDPRITGDLHQNLGSLAAVAKDFRSALDHFALSMTAYRKAGYVRGEAIAWLNQATALGDLDCCDEALTFLETAETLCRGLGEAELIGLCDHTRCEVLTKTGRFAEAHRAALRALQVFRAGELRVREAETLRTMGLMLRAQGDEKSAAFYIRSAAGLAREIGADPRAREFEALLTSVPGQKGPRRP